MENAEKIPCVFVPPVLLTVKIHGLIRRNREQGFNATYRISGKKDDRRIADTRSP